MKSGATFVPKPTHQVPPFELPDMAWSPKDIPDQSGRTFVITGANSGIGYHAAKRLVRRGAKVILACRRLPAAEAAAARINAKSKSGGKAIPAYLDLEDHRSIHGFVEREAPDRIDVLINNAGVMMIPHRITPQGHEAQWGINVVGHALLTKLLLPRIQERVVTISSIAHRHGRMKPETWHGDKYHPWWAYQQSKLGNLMFALRLQKHLEESGSTVKSVAAHPGVSLTRLAKDMPKGWMLTQLMYVPFLQSGDKGAWPTLRAATDDVPGGSYWGPSRFNEWRGPPAEAEIRPHALDAQVQETVWKAVWVDA